MGLKVAFKLPWAPAAGDFAPLWVAWDAKGNALSPDSAPGQAQLLCFLSASEGVNAFLEALAGSVAVLQEAGCSPLAFLPTKALADTPHAVKAAVDPDGSLARAFLLALEDRAGARSSGAFEPAAVLVDSGGRVLARTPLGISKEGALALVAWTQAFAPFSSLRPPHAAILQVPNVFTPAFCEELIAAFNSGPTVDGTTMVMRNGKFEHVVQPTHKQRRDLRLVPPWKDRVWEQLKWRLLPAVRKSFRFEISRLEYLQLGRYRAEDGGHFNPHRDDDSAGCSHRRFALTINLNEGGVDYQGGELVFHETGDRVRPQVGGAVVFSCSHLHEAKVVTGGDRFVLVGMFWGEAEEPIYQRNLTLGAAAKPRDPRPLRKTQIAESAKLLRELAGDVAALGAHLDSKAAQDVDASIRIARIHAELKRLRDELKPLQKGFLDEQTRRLPAAPDGLKLHLGCGSIRLPGWVNIDAGQGDVSLDLRWRLPFADNSATHIFASHVLEHLYRHGELPGLLREMLRVLKPGGVLRAIVPDIEKCLRAYTAGDAGFFEERKKTWSWAKSCKTPLDHFLAYAGANQALEGFEGHKYGYDFETLSLALREAGFTAITKSDFMQSADPVLRTDDQSHNAIANTNGVYYSLFVEVSKPV